MDSTKCFRYIRYYEKLTCLTCAITICIIPISIILRLTGLHFEYESPSFKFVLLADTAACMAFLIAAVFGAIVFSLWIYASANNKYFFRGRGFKNDVGPAMSVVWWFVPVLNFYFPFVALKQIWYASHFADYGDRKFPCPFINVLWALFVVYSISSLCEVFPESALSTTVATVISLLGIPYYYAMIIAVRKLSAAQHAAFNSMGAPKNGTR